MKDYLKRLVFLFFSFIILGIGIGFFMSSGLGGDPNSAFIEGVSLYYNISFSLSNIILNGILIIIILFIDKRYINVASFFAMIFVGYIVEIVMAIISSLIPLESLGFIQRFIMTIIGGSTLSLGIVLYINQHLGVAAFDATSELIAAKTNHEFKYVRIFMDITALILAFFFGGTIGVGTIYLSLTTGPKVKFIRQKLNIPSN